MEEIIMLIFAIFMLFVFAVCLLSARNRLNDTINDERDKNKIDGGGFELPF
jgi:hypothetical protein